MTPPTSGRSKHTPQLVVAQRVAAVASLLVRGAQRHEVLQAVAKFTQEEARARASNRTKITNAKQTGTAEALAKVAAIDDAMAGVPFVWGDAAIAERTVDRYIQQAKEQLVEDGLGAIEDLEAEIGLQYSRGVAVFNAAFRAGRFHAAMQAWEGLNKLLGAEEAAKLIRPNLDTAGGLAKSLPLIRVEASGPKIPDERRAALGLVAS